MGALKIMVFMIKLLAHWQKHNTVEFSGIEVNPTYETTMKAVEFAQKNEIDFILAVGGGSVADACKFISAAIYFEGEPWDILAKEALIKKAVPLGIVLTLPATGSESNCGAVITKKSSKDKLSFRNKKVQPVFAILDPEVMNSLPARQLGNGVVDAFVHTIEQYLTYDVNAKIQDRFAEGILQTLIEDGPKLFTEERNNDINANIMWSATQALNGLIGAGVPQDWATHMIGHEITALYNLDHAQTLAIVLPRVMWEMRESKQDKLLQYAQRVWHITDKNDQQAIKLAIEKTEQFFNTMQVKSRFCDQANSVMKSLSL